MCKWTSCTRTFINFTKHFNFTAEMDKHHSVLYFCKLFLPRLLNFLLSEVTCVSFISINVFLACPIFFMSMSALGVEVPRGVMAPNGVFKPPYFYRKKSNNLKTFKLIQMLMI